MSWIGPSSSNRSGHFNAAADWSPALVPASQATAVIGNSGAYTVSSGQSNTVGALTLSNSTATLAISTGTFAILGNSTVAGRIAVADAAALQITGTMTDTGTIALGSTGDATDLVVAGSATLKGAGELDLSDSAENAILSNGAAATLTNSSTIAGSGTIGDSNLSLINSAGAVIDATGATAALTLTSAATIKNSGLIEATGSAGLVIANATVSGGTLAASGGNIDLSGATISGGTLQSSLGSVIAIDGTADTLNGTTVAGSVSASDGTALTLKGTIGNSGTISLGSIGDAATLMIAGTVGLQGGGTLALSDSAGNAVLSNGATATLANSSTIAGAGTIGDTFMTLVNAAGATIDATGTNALVLKTGARTITNAGLIEATGSGGLTIASATSNSGTIEVSDGAALALSDTMTNSGSIAMDSTGDATDLAIGGSVLLKGAGQLDLSDWAENAILSNGAAATLTNSSTIAGSGTIGDSNLSLVNSAGAVIDATGAAAALTLTGAAGIKNSGLIEATGSAGLVIANTTVSGGTLAASGGNIDLSGATISGGTLQSSSGSVIAIDGTADTLNGTTVAGSVSAGDGTALTLKGTIGNSGSIALDSSGDATDLMLNGKVTLAGGGTLALSDSAGNAVLSNGAAATLTNSSTIAGAGTIGDTLTTLVNAAGATIDATGTDALVLNTGTHTIANDGLIEATGAGGLTIAGAVSNTGTLAAGGGTLSVLGQVTGTGADTISGGTLAFGNKVASTQSVTFGQNTTGTLALGLAQSFAGTVAGLTGNDAVDLTNFQFVNQPTVGPVTAISLNGSSGVAVTVKDGSLTATIDLLNQYGSNYSTNPASYVLTSDANGAHPGTLLQLAPPVA